MNTPDLTTYAHRHLTPLGITVAQAQHDAQIASSHPNYSTVKALDALRRLRAHAMGQPTPVAEYAPITTPLMPICICADGADLYSVSHGQHDTTIARDSLLDYLSEHELATAGETPRTLIVDTPQTLRHLRSLAAHSSDSTTAAVVDWWVQRADHPGTTCTYIASVEPTKRWVTGLAPEQEDHPDVWAQWLGLPNGNTPAQTCEAIIRATAAGPPLEGLQECHGSDLASWKYLTKRNLTRYRPGNETQRDAAMGLATRNHAAEYYDSLRLSDPLVAQSATLAGHLVQGVIQSYDNNIVQVLADTAISRFRVGAEAQAWHGPVGSATRTVTLRAGHITEIAVTATGRLDIRIEDTVVVAPLIAGDTITLRPRIVDPHQQTRLRIRYSARLRDQRNWVSRALPPPTQRRTVPMDVVLAAAPDED